MGEQCEMRHQYQDIEELMIADILIDQRTI